MTFHLPRLPFPFDPLIVEAKRRMRRRRALIAITLLLVGAITAAGLVAGHSPGGPRSAGRLGSQLGGGGRTPAGLASSAVPSFPDIEFTKSHHLPAAGHTFAGVAILNANASTPTKLWVGCDALIGGKFVRARKNFFYEPRHRTVQAVVCSWRIPANAGGKRLLLLNTEGPGGAPDNRVEVVVTAKGSPPTSIGSPVWSWVVQKR